MPIPSVEKYQSHRDEYADTRNAPHANEKRDRQGSQYSPDDCSILRNFVPCVTK